MDDNKMPPQNKKQQSLIAKSEKGRLLSARSDTQVYEAIRAALADARGKVVAAVNTAMVGVYWEIGRQITEAVGERAEPASVPFRAADNRIWQGLYGAQFACDAPIL